jgi:Holliday junction DNA helicase RuvA
MRLPGIGRKTAERIVIEMRDRVRHPGLAGGGSVDGSAPGPMAPRDEALDALVALGYKAPEARRMLDRVPETVTSTEELLRAVLRSAAPTKG